jgi:L-threonine-O-3-phosphate decarboxylase
MDPDVVADIGRVPHGGTDEHDRLDFSANTNPDRPDGVAGVYESALSVSRRYPSDEYAEFRDAAGAYLGCDAESVVPLPGAMAAIRLALEVTVGPGDSVLVPAPSFGEYEREVRLQGATPEFVAHDEILAADPAPHDLAVVCNPNNPTGEAADPADLRAFADRCRAADTPLLVDEAFLDFTDHPTLAGAPGVVVARSLTKIFGLPGLRAGMAVATGDLRERLEAARPPWALSTPAAAVGVHCLARPAFVERTRERVAAERARMRDALCERFEVFSSDAPYLLLDAGDRDVDAIVAGMADRGIAVRDARTFRTLDSHVRVAVKRPDQNDRLLAAMADV